MRLRFSQKKPIVILFVAITFINCSVGYSQSTIKEKNIAAYIYNLSSRFEWENEKNLNEFSILLITSNNKLIEELQQISETLTIKNKPIFISTNNYNVNVSTLQLIFISEEKNSEYEKFLKSTNGYPVLIITYNNPNRNSTMLNLYNSNDKIRFEMNWTLIQKRNIKINNELLLQESINRLDRKYDSLGTEISHQKRNILIQDSILRTKNKLLEIKDSILTDNSQKISAQNTLIVSQNKTLLNQKDDIAKKELLLSFSDKLLDKRLKEIQNLNKRQLAITSSLDSGNKILQNQKKHISIMNSTITKNNSILNSQKTVIDKQQKTMRLSRIIIILSILTILIILNGLIIIRAKNKKLKAQKKEIEHGNSVLKDANEELHATNEKLKKTLEQLNATQDQLIHSEKMASLGVLTAGIAHELNNPINFVYAGANSMKKDFVDIEVVLNQINVFDSQTQKIEEQLKKIEELKKQHEFDDAYKSLKQTLNHIILGAERAAEIIKGLSQFSRIEKEDWDFLDIHESLENVLILLKNKYKYTIDIHKLYGNNLPLVQCYAGKINQVLMNIIE